MTDRTIKIPDEMHHDTAQLVVDFAEEMARKLRAAEVKYGYSNSWLTESWNSRCEEALFEHLLKGDPRDVAIYAAFMWRRGWSVDLPHRIRTLLQQLAGELGLSCERPERRRTYPVPRPRVPPIENVAE